MRINDTDQSAVSQYTNRSLLLDKTQPIKPYQPSFPIPTPESLFKIIRDKSTCLDFEEDQSNQNKLINWYKRFQLIRPENPLIVIWNVVNVMVIIFYLLEFPMILGFGRIVWDDISTKLVPLTVFFYIIMIGDIFLTPLKMKYREGLLIKDRKILLSEYLEFNFWIDVMALFSVVFPLILRQYYAANLIKILFYPKIIILNQLDMRIVKVLVFNVKAKTFYLIGRLVVFMIMISHYIGIGFYMVGYYVYSTNYYGPNTPNLCWLYNAEAYSQIILLLDWKGQYLYTMYFSIGMTTTIAYGDITPLNPLQALYIVFALVTNTIAFGYILSEILRILIQAFYAEFDKNNLKYAMENILVSRKIKPKLRQSIRAHMEQISKEEMYRDRKIQREVIFSMPFNLQIGLYGKIYQEFIQSIKLSPDQFYTDKNRNSRFVERILLEITQVRYLVGDLIYREGEQYTEELNNHKAYFLKDKTKVQDIVLGVGKSPTVGLENHQIQNQQLYMLFFIDRPYFGNAQFYTGNKRSHWVMSKNNILLYELPRRSLLQNLRYASKKQLEYMNELKQKITDSYCYICYGDHNFKRCPRTQLIPNVIEAVTHTSQKQKMRRRQNSRIEEMRLQKRSASIKSNALRTYKTFINQKDRKALQKSKIRLLASSKHYRRVFHQQQQSSSQTSSDTSSDSSEDLDFLITQTKMLISNLNKGQDKSSPQDYMMWDGEFDNVYEFRGYKVRDNVDSVVEKFTDLQRVQLSKKRIWLGMRMREE